MGLPKSFEVIRSACNRLKSSHQDVRDIGEKVLKEVHSRHVGYVNSLTIICSVAIRFQRHIPQQLFAFESSPRLSRDVGLQSSLLDTNISTRAWIHAYADGEGRGHRHLMRRESNGTWVSRVPTPSATASAKGVRSGWSSTPGCRNDQRCSVKALMPYAILSPPFGSLLGPVTPDSPTLAI